MIRIFLLDNRLLPSNVKIDFGASETERLNSIKNQARRRESLGALVALDQLIKMSFADRQLEIVRDQNGKPHFKDGEISFSLSHSKDISVAAICDEKDAKIGVDIEMITDRSNIEELSERYFNCDEKCNFKELGKTSAAFFKLWTKKESYAKMTGVGLATIIGKNDYIRKEIAQEKYYEFYNSNDAYALSFCCSSKNNNVEFYNNSSDIKIKQL